MMTAKEANNNTAFVRNEKVGEKTNHSLSVIKTKILDACDRVAYNCEVNLLLDCGLRGLTYNFDVRTRTIRQLEALGYKVTGTKDNFTLYISWEKA